MLYQVTSNNFCAGLITNKNGIVIRSAPILKYSIGKDIDYIRKYSISKRWNFSRVVIRTGKEIKL